MIKNFYRFLIIQLFLFFAVFNQNAISKSLPPGSGAGDVKANILILLDTSLSMNNKPFGGAAIYFPGDLILLDDGDVIVGQTSSAALVKFTYSDEKFDSSFVDPDGDGVGKRMFYGSSSDSTCVLETGDHDSRIRTVGSMDVSKDVKDTTPNSEIIYSVAIEQQKVVAIDAEGNCIEVIDHNELGKTNTGKFDKIKPLALDIRTIDSKDYLIVTGHDITCTKTRWIGRKKKRRKICSKYTSDPFWYARNLKTGTSVNCTIPADGALRSLLGRSTSIAIDDGNNAYFANVSKITKFPMTLTGGVYCPTMGGSSTNFTSGFNYPSQIAIDPQDDSIMWATSTVSHTIQKLAVSSSAITTTTTVGTQNKEATPSSAATDATKTYLYNPSALFVSNDRAWIGGGKVSIQEFNISTGDNITWVDELGTTRVSRAEGAKNAIAAVVNDSSLTSGAYFGYGFWNGGTEYAKKGKKAKNKWCKNCEYTCHRECPMTGKKKKYWNCNNHCDYYRGWSGGTHPTGQSSQCDKNSCLAVGVGPNTTSAILHELKYMKLRFATDANAFSQMAYEYFNDPKVNLVDDKIPCQLNYVILIGDGKWTHHDQALNRIRNLRHHKKVKTIVFAYGGGISGVADENFKDMAKAGSCDDENFGTADETDSECRQRIIAESPADLVQKLKSEVERIIASRLSFSAPSITATIQEGGDLYQAQFEYLKHGEWTGHLLRKKIKPDGSIVHELDEAGNWNAGDKVREQALGGTRKIWTALKGADYKTDYNNFVVKNATLINKLFQINGNSVADYHNLTSACKAQTGQGVANGNSDDIDGLIKFVRGYDYFGYKGCANMGEIRDSVLGDIYHSQIVEVGRPSANTLYTGRNQEAYFRSKNGYSQWAAANANRDRTLYVGANDGMLHAFDATNGNERWAFIPPFIAGRLPEVINTGLDGVEGTGAEAKGGTISIFAVDGSPVIHDMYITGIKPDGTWETEGTKSWHTILFIPYGRGGRGFSVLDVTDPHRPHHIFSVYNDWDRKKIMIAKQDGTIINDVDNKIDGLTYTGGSMSVDQSLEAERAIANQTRAYDADILLDSSGDTFTNRDTAAECSTSSTFYIDNDTSACYKGSTFTFNYIVPDDVLDNPTTLEVYEEVDRVQKKIAVTSIVQDGSLAKITLGSSRYFSVATGDETDEEEDSPSFDIVIPNAGAADARYDYSSLGETWSTPRIFRLPVDRDLGADNDQYVAVLPGGFGRTGTLGSSVFIIDLENMAEQSGDNYPGALVDGGEGLIKIADLDNAIEIDGSKFEDVGNNITGDPVVITPDTFRGATWRGAMVYVNDFEGKITKINLTSDKQSNDGTEIDLFDHTTLFSLNTNQENGRYSYFGMDAAFGTDSRSLYLFGSTGDFSDIGSKTKGMDNILYGVRDKDFPYFRLVNSGTVGSYLEAQNASKVDNNYIISSNCVNTAEDVGDCPAREKDAWIFKLDKPYNKEFDISPSARDDEGNSISAGNMYRKASASPTVYKGTVYYPVYEPPAGSAACSVGNAFICSADDECGTNTSEDIAYAQKTVGAGSQFDYNSGCYYLQPGVLSRLVVFSDKLFANITTSSEDQKDTLVSLLSTQGYISSFKGGWRHNF